MTVLEAIHEFDSLKPNTYSQEQKITWLDRLDRFILSTILSRYEEGEALTAEEGDPDRQLLMEEPFTQGYIHWLESKVHYFNEEMDRYNSAVMKFRAIFEDYQRSLHEKKRVNTAGTFRY